MQLQSSKKKSHFSVTKTLYAIGSIIVIIGILFFVQQIWGSIGSFSRIAITLGLGIAITFSGLALSRGQVGRSIDSVFYLIGGVLIPSGIVVTTLELEITDPWMIAFTTGLAFVFYLVLNFVDKNSVLTLFSIFYGTSTSYLALAATSQHMDREILYDLYHYLTIAIGTSYLFLAHSFASTWNKRLVSFLRFFGVLGILISTFLLQNYDSLFSIFSYSLVIAGLFFLAGYMKSGIILTLSSLFLIAHIWNLTNEYFADSIGWPLTLIFMGLIIIGIGFISVTINKKYIEKKSSQ
tara:strand:- start:5775 stop:6656 length:882 start_codon:yes stop_codon:yes gene_type:complete